MNNSKIDARLNMEIINPTSDNLDLSEVIVKYNGDISIIKQDIEVYIEVLSSNYAILTLNIQDVYKLVTYREIEYIEMPKTLMSVLNIETRSSCVTKVRKPPYNLTGKGVIVGIIDSGINYLHKDFKDENDKTRIKYIWDQTIEGNPPDGFIGGSVYTESMINEALLSSNPYSVVPHKDEIGHGTAVAGIATSSQGVAPESSIIIVKIGERGREYFARNTEIMRAIKFIIDKGIELDMPVAINLSFGTNDGEHTGKSLFETYIDDMTNIWKSSIVVATGNEGNTGHHYKNKINTGQKVVIEAKIGSDIKSLSITLFKNFIDDFDINIILPNGKETGLIRNTDKMDTINLGNTQIMYYITEPTPYNINQSILFKFISQTTLSEGIINIEVFGRKVVQGDIDIWLPVIETSSKDTKFLQPSLETTLTIPSTANNVISVGGYDDYTDTIASFSGRGYNKNGDIKPDIVAPAINVVSTSNTGGYDRFTGTSMASPFVVGASALLMEWGIVNENDIFLYGQRMKAFLRSGATRKSGIEYPNKKWGFGSLCVANSLEQLIDYKNEITIQEINNNINNEDISDFAYSEDYITLIAQYNPETIKILAKYKFIKAFNNSIKDFIILYIEKEKIGTLTREEIEQMALQEPFVLGIMDTLPLESSGVIAVQNQPFLNLKGSGVLIGIVDTGINYTLKEFIYPDNTTKIVSIWDQSINSNCIKTKYYGTEYSREDINEALKSENPFSIVPSNDEIGHGTRLASVCAGFKNKDEDFIGVAPDSELVIVKLKQVKKYLREENFINDGVPAFDSSDFMQGVDYLYEKAVELNRPIAICIGIGTNDGTHNGGSILEKNITDIATKNGVCVSVCSGNEGDAGHHTYVELTDTNKEKVVEINVGKNKKGIKITFIAYPPDRISVNIISPLGESTGRLPPRDNYDEEINFILSNSSVRVEYFNNVLESSGQVVKISIKNPNEGIWKVNIFGEQILIGEIHGWLPITAFVGEDTYFMTPDPFYSITTPATSDTVLSVGGYNSFDGSFYPKSGRGPLRTREVRPILCAPSVAVSSIGTNGKLDLVTGTSVGTAITSGCSALLLEWGIIKGNNTSMNTITVTSYLISGTERTPNNIYPNNLWGFGKLNILNTFKNI